MKEDTNIKYRNKLSGESSPYLMQHAGNPVNWYPWGKEAFEKARQENKLMLISIGYAACHWCHVMEHESFEDSEVAEVMNQHFVCIKVDREERPDVDQVYMNAVQLLTGRGGWPLNCFVLPDGRPFYGGTYFPKANWLKILSYLSDTYKFNKDNVLSQADRVLSAIKDYESTQVHDDTKEFDISYVESYSNRLIEGLDINEGGTSGAPKFPMPGIWLYLLRYHHTTGNAEALELTNLTLRKLANGGIYDHIGGGFARYSVDAHWHVPHFEKMLYDNAQLISVYSEAYQLTHEPLYKKMVYETIEFVSRELTSPEGTFYSSLDADSEGEEGRFYIWKKSEIDAILGNDSTLFSTFYNVTEAGNWETGKNILHITKSPEEVASEFKITVDHFRQLMLKWKALLLDYRGQRTKPALDNKALTSWNALMIKGLTDAYRAFNEKSFLDRALRAANIITTRQTKDNHGLFRNYMNGNSSISAFLDDYALVINALLGLYRCTFEETWLSKASNYLDYVIEHFTDEDTSLFYYTDKDHHDLVVRKPEITDNVIPSSNSVMALNLFRMGKYLNRSDYLEKSLHMLRNSSGNMLQYSQYHTNWAILMLNHAFPPKEVAISGKEAEIKRQQLEVRYLPEIILVGSSQPSNMEVLKGLFSDNVTQIYICEDYTCKLPVESVEDALKLLHYK